MNAVDVPKSAVRLAFMEATQDAVVARIRHSYGPACSRDLACRTCAMWVWTQGVLASWWRADIGADDLQAALLWLRGGAR